MAISYGGRRLLARHRIPAGEVRCDRCWRTARPEDMTPAREGEVCPHCVEDHGRACRCDECCARTTRI